MATRSRKKAEKPTDVTAYVEPPAPTGKVAPRVRRFIPCTEVSLPPHLHEEAARIAVEQNPANGLMLAGLHKIPAARRPKPAFLALLVNKYWPAKGVNLTVSFMETITPDLRDRILSHMNAWGTVAGANVKFSWTQGAGQVRISRGAGGYWSFIGTDVLAQPAGKQTMNLEGFTMQTRDSEFYRVVRHETGHVCGWPHEHARPEIVALLDPQKTIAYFQRTQGWTPQQIMQQILTPLKAGDVVATPAADQVSIMTYSFPGEVTRSGQPIVGGTDIDDMDKAFAVQMYPPAGDPVTPVTPVQPVIGTPGGPVMPHRPHRPPTPPVTPPVVPPVTPPGPVKPHHPPRPPVTPPVVPPTPPVVPPAPPANDVWTYTLSVDPTTGAAALS